MQSRILTICNYKESKGGISIQVDFLMKKLMEMDFSIELFNTKLSIFGRILSPIRLYFKSKNFDLFYIHGCSNYGFFPIVLGVFIANLVKKEVIITYHGGGAEKFLQKYPKTIRYFLLKAKTLTVPSMYLFNVFKKYGIDSIYLPNVIKEDNVLFKNRAKIEPNLITTRSLEEVYNIPMAIRAFSIIKIKYPDATLKIVGDGALRKDLEELVSKSKIQGVTFVGSIKNSEIGAVLNTADIYINPTTADNMPLSLFEAFACGLPVISTNVGGLSDFIENKVNGFLIESGDDLALTNRIEFILNNQDLAQKVLLNAHRNFQKFTWESLKEEYRYLFNT